MLLQGSRGWRARCGTPPCACRAFVPPRVTGPYDIVAVTEWHDLEELYNEVIGRMQAIEGILRALPCVVRARSRKSDEGGG